MVVVVMGENKVSDIVEGKKGAVSSAIGWWLIGLGVVIVMYIFYKLVIAGNSSFIDFIADKWRFGG